MDPFSYHLTLFLPLGIVLIVAAARTVRTWIAFKERQLQVTSDTAAERAAQYAAKTERLEQRVAVLERILTDRSGNLADEIERLRDSPLN
jgi:ABC-type phosphate transport system auxiliary subunit